jgi:hypothetical protein
MQVSCVLHCQWSGDDTTLHELLCQLLPKCTNGITVFGDVLGELYLFPPLFDLFFVWPGDVREGEV